MREELTTVSQIRERGGRLAGCVMQSVDLREFGTDDWAACELAGAHFLGCLFDCSDSEVIIRKHGGVARMSPPELIERIMSSVSIPVMAKARIGHFVEAQVLEALGVDYFFSRRWHVLQRFRMRTILPHLGQRCSPIFA